jgi:four helix bundle protein
MNPTPKGASAVQLDAYRVALEMIRSLRSVMPKIRANNPSLTTQIEKAAPSVAQNLNEGRRRVGKDRRHLWRIAAGSADEVRACLDVAEAWGYVAPADIAATQKLIDRILAMTWRMTH